MWSYIKYSWKKTCAHCRVVPRMQSADFLDDMNVISEHSVMNVISEHSVDSMGKLMIKDRYKNEVWNSVSAIDRDLIEGKHTILSFCMCSMGGVLSWKLRNDEWDNVYDPGASLTKANDCDEETVITKPTTKKYWIPTKKQRFIDFRNLQI